MRDGADRNFESYLRSPDAQLASWEELQQLSAVATACVLGDSPGLPAAAFAAIRAELGTRGLADSRR
jgi:hypothetical protein